jgi:hypothetical protein
LKQNDKYQSILYNSKLLEMQENLLVKRGEISDISKHSTKASNRTYVNPVQGVRPKRHLYNSIDYHEIDEASEFH